MLSMCRTAIGTPPVTAEAALSSAYNDAIYIYTYITIIIIIIIIIIDITTTFTNDDDIDHNTQ